MSRHIAPALALVALLLPAPARAGVEKYGDQFKNTTIGLNKVPHFGKSRVLVVPLEFGNKYDFKSLDAFFDNSDGAAYSFRKYWQLNSFGAYDVTVDVLPVVHFDACPAPNNPTCEFTAQNGQEAIVVVKAVFEKLDNELGVDFTKYDTNGPDGQPDGYCDGIIFLVPNYNGGIAPPIYPFMKNEDGTPANIWDGITVGAIAISNTDAQTILHEFGHLLGFADLYNFDLDYSLMSFCSDCILDADSRVKIGWADVVDVAAGETTELLLRPASESKPVYRVARPREDKPGEEPKEYFLIEYRRETKVGGTTLDEGLDGVAVYHVDENKEAPVIAQSNYPAWHPLIMNERPTNNQSKRTLFHQGDELQPNSIGDQAPADEVQVAHWNSNWYDGLFSGIRIDEVRPVDEDGPGYRIRVRGLTTFEEASQEVPQHEDGGAVKPVGGGDDAGSVDVAAGGDADASGGSADSGPIVDAAPMPATGCSSTSGPRSPVLPTLLLLGLVAARPRRTRAR